MHIQNYSNTTLIILATIATTTCTHMYMYMLIIKGNPHSKADLLFLTYVLLCFHFLFQLLSQLLLCIQRLLTCREHVI